MQCIRSAVVRLLAVAAAMFLVVPAFAGPINAGQWLQFSFSTPGVPATGCNPADLAGDFCIPSSGVPSAFLDAPPWTYTAPAQGALLFVTDAFASGDRFELFDGGVSIGLTSIFTAGVACGDDPSVCIGTPGMSTGVFNLAPGNHSLTLSTTLDSGSFGSGFLQVQPVPEPSTVVFAMTGLGAIALSRFHRRKAATEVSK